MMIRFLFPLLLAAEQGGGEEGQVIQLWPAWVFSR